MTQSAFDLGAFNSVFGSDKRKDLVYMARTAEAAERYEDMCQFMKALVKWSSEQSPIEELTVEERNLLSVAYKNVIGARRASWRTLAAEDNTTPTNEIMELYKKQVEAELSDICTEILDLLENTLIKNHSAQDEARVFYLKMTGDYYRYLAESVTDQDNEKQAAEFYRQAYATAETQLEPTHPIRLGLALNFSVCHYEILKDKKAACELAKKAFDEAISKLDKLEEADYKDSTLIMQLLRDNLTLWTSNEGDPQDVEVEEIDD